MEPNSQLLKSISLWRTIAIIAGIFAFVLCILIIANFVQINQHDPVNTEVINSLVERLNKTPDDQALRNEVREFDLLARKAYFTNQWQIRAGGYLLLISLIIIVIAFQFMNSAKKKIPIVEGKDHDKISATQKKARKWIAIAGICIALVTLIFAFISHKELENKFTNAANPETLADSSMVNIAEVIEIEPTTDTASQPADTILPATDSLNTAVAVDTTQEKAPVKTLSSPKSNFPSFRGPGGNGIAYHNNIPEKWDGASGSGILWKTEIPVHGYNSPVVWDDKIFLSGADASTQQVYCFDANSGKILWTAKADNVPGSPGTAPKTTDDTGLSAPSVATDGESVFAIFGTGDLIALDMSGKEIWSKNMGVPGNHYGHSSSLLVHKGKLIIQYDQKKGAKVMALSTKNGDVIWSTDRKVKISWASPTIVNTGSRDEIILISDPFVASYDPASGKELWKLDCIYGEVGPSVAYADGIVFAMNEYAVLVAIDIKSGEPKKLWEDNEFLSDVPSPVATDKYVFIPTSYGVVACYDAKTGEKIWDHDFSVGVYASPMLVDGKIYLLDKKGTMHIFKPDNTFNLVSEPKLGVASVSTPAFSNGRIYIRADKTLYCIGK